MTGVSSNAASSQRTAQTVARKREIVLVPDLEREPRGVRALADIRERGITQAAPEANSRCIARKRQRVRRPRRSAAAWTFGTLHAARLVFFLGKGGTGKTTTAAATAVALARSKPNERVLLLSMDPAHSLGDVFGRAVGDAPVAIESRLPNLLVRELDAPAMLAARRAVLRTALDELVAVLGTGTLGPSGSRGFSELLELTPPGIDELFGLVSMMEADVGIDADAFGVVVIDAAPTGHALRLLEMPDAAHDWVQVLIRMLLKYRRVVRPGRLAAELIELSKSIRSVRQLLRSPDLARFVVVTRAQAVPRHETERLLKHLRKLRVDVSTMVINAMTLAPGECRRCQTAAAAESRAACATRSSVPAGIPRVRYHPDPARRAAAAWRGRARTLGASVDDMKQKGTYVYCLVAARQRPSLRGVPKGLPYAGAVRLVDVSRSGTRGMRRWLVVADVPLDRFSEAAINHRLHDLDWVARAAVAHEAVVESFVDAAALVPMKLFTIFTNDERALEHIAGERERVQTVLKRVAHHDEWGVRVVLDRARAVAPRTKVAAERRKCRGRIPCRKESHPRCHRSAGRSRP